MNKTEHDTVNTQPYLKFYLAHNPNYNKVYTEEELVKLVDEEFNKERKIHEPGRTYLHTKEEIKEMILTFNKEFSQYPYQMGRVAIIPEQEEEIIKATEQLKQFYKWYTT